MEVKLFQDPVDLIRSFAMLVYSIEHITCSLGRQCWNFDSLAIRGDGGDAGGDANTNVAESNQLIHHGVDLFRVHPLRVENGFSIVKDYDHLLRRQVLSQGCKILGVFDACTDNLGELMEKVRARGREFIATNEPSIITKPLLDPIVVEDSQDSRCLADASSTD